MKNKDIIHSLAVAVGNIYSKIDPPKEMSKFLKIHGLTNNEALECFHSNNEYMYQKTEDALNCFSATELKLFIEYILPKIDSVKNRQILGYYLDQFKSPLTSESRVKTAEVFALYDFFGEKDFIDSIQKFFNLSGYDNETRQKIDYPRSRVLEHATLRDQKLSNNEVFKYIGAYDCSTTHFLWFLEFLLDPSHRSEQANKELVNRLNEIIGNDGYEIVVDQDSKIFRTKYIITEKKKESIKVPKQIIFASKNVKPDFGITDVLDGEISLIANTNSLNYDQKIYDHLTWQQLEDWWEDNNLEIDKGFKKRLIESLDSEAEIMFFKAYFINFGFLGDKLPALLPQVYVAYDPVSAKDLPNGKTRIRQRIDFLMILPNLKRVIIEIDGKHHYAREDGWADPKRYAEMVRVDRELRLRGYEVYRFGGAEFYNDQNTAEENTVSIVKDFFTALFKQHEIL
ncbi:hypothetical protein F965_02368 [Acinetobacter schindleri NIPH 900]|uniref:AbiJ-NTD3 domain-containing protein n=1 Tax=Acinetobacter schindleri NIPH 900 TaxID=1217675 RepID=N8WJT5_9GAMM|nr:hypothetical protein [Acinetobacter schindleri]ENV12347.1 hypothetical protein F965_02368 [Acinetobacter schindleri NIPH 900]